MLIMEGFEIPRSITTECGTELQTEIVRASASEGSVVIIPGANGLRDGERTSDKRYLCMAEYLADLGISSLRTSNPLGGGYFDEAGNFKAVMEYAQEMSMPQEVSIVGFSAGARMAAERAVNYSKYIRNLVLINPDPGFTSKETIDGIKKFTGKLTVIRSAKDPNGTFADQLLANASSQKRRSRMIPGENHLMNGLTDEKFAEFAKYAIPLPKQSNS